jgi:hypothetical protein
MKFDPTLARKFSYENKLKHGLFNNTLDLIIHGRSLYLTVKILSFLFF